MPCAAPCRALKLFRRTLPGCKMRFVNRFQDDQARQREMHDATRRASLCYKAGLLPIGVVFLLPIFSQLKVRHRKHVPTVRVGSDLRHVTSILRLGYHHVPPHSHSAPRQNPPSTATGGGVPEVDPETPSSACASQYDSAGQPLTLVFSDEFNVPGRSMGSGQVRTKQQSP